MIKIFIREKSFVNYRIIYRIKPDVKETTAICHGNRLLENVFL